MQLWRNLYFNVTFKPKATLWWTLNHRKSQMPSGKSGRTNRLPWAQAALPWLSRTGAVGCDSVVFLPSKKPLSRKEWSVWIHSSSPMVLVPSSEQSVCMVLWALCCGPAFCSCSSMCMYMYLATALQLWRVSAWSYLWKTVFLVGTDCRTRVSIHKIVGKGIRF